MKKALLCFLIIISSGIHCFSQENFVSEVISDCDGSINIIEPGVFSIQFTGQGGFIKDIAAYPSLDSVAENNSIWCSFIAPFDGVINLDASINTGFIQMVIFEQSLNDVCDEIHRGIADIKRLIIKSSSSSVALNKTPNEDQLYSLELREGQKIILLFNTVEKSKERLKLVFNYEVLNNSDPNSKGETKVVDLRDDEFTPAFHVVVRDAATGFPVIANLTILGLKTVSALYMGSDFYFVISKNGKVTIKCDAKGYFFADRTENVVANIESEFTIWLEPLKQGKSLQIEEIEFHPGSSDFTPTSEGKLQRLKDFMALNSDVKIEIQGHVFALDDNSFAGQKLSEARAKRVYNYLVSNGINKDRMTAVGFGNTRPIYPKPKLAYEEQMNRRVEIKVQ